MFDKLLDFIFTWGGRILPWVIMDEFERGVVLRLGRYHRTLDTPGLHWRIPLAEAVLSDNIVPKVYDLKTQSLTTKDNKSIIVSGVVTLEITNIKKALLEVENVESALADSITGFLGEKIRDSLWEDICKPGFSEELKQICHKPALKFGITLIRIQLSDLSPSKTLRILNV